MKKESMFIIGMSSLSMSLIMGTFLPEFPIISFFEGIFVGISLAMNISFLIRHRIEKNGYNEREKRTQGGSFGEK